MTRSHAIFKINVNFGILLDFQKSRKGSTGSPHVSAATSTEGDTSWTRSPFVTTAERIHPFLGQKQCSSTGSKDSAGFQPSRWEGGMSSSQLHGHNVSALPFSPHTPLGPLISTKSPCHALALSETVRRAAGQSKCKVGS